MVFSNQLAQVFVNKEILLAISYPIRRDPTVVSFALCCIMLSYSYICIGSVSATGAVRSTVGLVKSGVSDGLLK